MLPAVAGAAIRVFPSPAEARAPCATPPFFSNLGLPWAPSLQLCSTKTDGLFCTAAEEGHVGVF